MTNRVPPTLQTFTGMASDPGALARETAAMAFFTSATVGGSEETCSSSRGVAELSHPRSCVRGDLEHCQRVRRICVGSLLCL